MSNFLVKYTRLWNKFLSSLPNYPTPTISPYAITQYLTVSNVLILTDTITSETKATKSGPIS